MWYKQLNILAIIVIIVALYFSLVPFGRNIHNIFSGKLSDKQMYCMSTHAFVMAIAIWVGCSFNITNKFLSN